MNPMVGSRMQQACELLVEKAVEVVRTHGDGTSGSLAATRRRHRTNEATRTDGAGSGHQG